MSFACLQVTAQCFTVGKVDITQWQADFTDGIVSTETIVVKHLHVQRFGGQLRKRKTYKTLRFFISRSSRLSYSAASLCPVPQPGTHFQQPFNTIQYNNSICRALFTKRPGALTETSDDMLCEIVQSLNGA